MYFVVFETSQTLLEHVTEGHKDCFCPNESDGSSRLSSDEEASEAIDDTKRSVAHESPGMVAARSYKIV